MSKPKASKYSGKELDWLKAQYNSLKQYVDSNPIEGMKDRIIKLSTGRAEIDKVTASIEQQIKSVRDTLKEMPEILSAIDKLSAEDESAEILIKGNDEMPGIMRSKFK